MLLLNVNAISWFILSLMISLEMRSITTGIPFTNIDKLYSQHGNVIIWAVKCEMKLVIHKQVLMVHPKHCWSCDYLFTLGLNFMRISVKSPGWTYYTVYVTLVKGFVWKRVTAAISQPYRGIFEWTWSGQSQNSWDGIFISSSVQTNITFPSSTIH